jgi:hypothetical protein
MMRAQAQRTHTPQLDDLGFGSLLGRIEGLTGVDARVIVEGEDLRWEVAASTGSFRLDRLEPGPYRVELRSERLVLAKRIEVVAGHNTVTLQVHPNVARRIGASGRLPSVAPVIQLHARL